MSRNVRITVATLIIVGIIIVYLFEIRSSRHTEKEAVGITIGSSVGHGVEEGIRQNEGLIAKETKNSVAQPAAPVLETSRKYAQLPPIEDFFLILKDPSRANEWAKTIRQIVSYGKSNESTQALLEFIGQELPPSTSKSSIFQIGLVKMDALTLIGITGGKKAEEALREVFRKEDDHLYRSWLDRLAEDDAPDERYVWENGIRGRAATGLLISGSRSNEKLVRDAYADLRKRYNSLTDSEDHLFWILVDSLAISDIAKAEGTNFLLEEGFGESHLFQDSMDESREKYLPR